MGIDRVVSEELRVPLLIGDVAKRAGVTPKTVRYYEELGLIRPAGRTFSRYRFYDDHVVERLKFIRACQALTLSLNQIAGVLAAHDSGQHAGDRMRAIIADHATAIDRQISALTSLRQELGGVLARQRGMTQHERPRVVDLIRLLLADSQ